MGVGIGAVGTDVEVSVGVADKVCNGVVVGVDVGTGVTRGVAVGRTRRNMPVKGDPIHCMTNTRIK